MTSVSFGNIALLGPSVGDGRLQVSTDGVQWNGSGALQEKRITVAAKNIKAAKWVDAGVSNALWLTDSAGTLFRFMGFPSSSHEKVADALQRNFKVALSKGRMAAKGQNFGNIRVRDGAVELVGSDGCVLAPIPLSSVAMASLPSRNEVEIQCMDDDTGDKDDECLLEMRLYMPEFLDIEGAERRAGKGKGGDDDDDEEDSGESSAQALHRIVLETAGLTGSTDKPLAEIPEEVGSFLVPRGRFAVELHPTHLRMSSPSYEFKITYKSIARITYLPLPNATGGHEDASKFAIVISLDDPLRMGLQRHPHLVLQLDRKPYELPISIPAEDVKAGKYEGLGADGSESVKGDLPKVVGQLLKKITGKPVYKPESFTSASGQRCVRCSHKAAGGLLFPLDKSCMFIHKPAVWLKYSDVESVLVERYGGTSSGAARTFDLTLRCRASAGEPAREYLFQGVDRGERDSLVNFLKGRGLTVKDDGGDGKKANYAAIDEALGDDDDDDDEDEDDEGYGSEDAHRDDKKAAKEDEARGLASGDDEDDEDEDDGFARKRKGKGGAKAPPAKRAKKAESKSKGKSKPKPKAKKGKRKDSDDDDDDDEDDEDDE